MDTSPFAVPRGREGGRGGGTVDVNGSVFTDLCVCLRNQGFRCPFVGLENFHKMVRIGIEDYPTIEQERNPTQFVPILRKKYGIIFNERNLEDYLSVIGKKWDNPIMRMKRP